MKTVRDILTTKVETVASDMPLVEAAALMSKRHISCLISLENGKPAGILTERDLLHAITLNSSATDTIRTHLHSPLITARQSMSIYEAFDYLNAHQVRHLVVTDEAQNLVGMATFTDIVKASGFDDFLTASTIAPVMSTAIITVTPESKVGDALKLMDAKQISCVIVTRDNKPVGIITERDVAPLFSAARAALEQPVSQLMSSPVTTIAKDALMLEASDMMNRSGIRRVVVVDSLGHATGIVTQYDIVRQMSGHYIETLRNTLAEVEGHLDEKKLLDHIIAHVPAVHYACQRVGNDFERSYLSPNIEAMLGVTPENCLHDPLFLQRILHPDDRAETLATLERGFESAANTLAVEYRIIRHDGTTRWIRDEMTLNREPDGSIREVIGSWFDVSAQVESQSAIIESEEKYRHLIEYAFDAIFIADAATGLITETNRQAEILMAMPRDRLIGMHQSQLHPAGEAERYREIFQHHIESGRVVSETLYIQRPDGSRIPIEISASIIESSGRKLLQGVFRDISERVEQQKQLKRKQQQLEIMARVGRNIHRAADVPKLMQALTEAAMEMVAATSGAAAIFSDGVIKFREYNQHGTWIGIDLDFPPGYGVPGWVIEHKKAYLSDDAETDPHVIPEIQQALKFKTLIDTPILSRDGELLGCFEIHDRIDGQPFDAIDREMLQALADSTAIAFENARMMRHLQRAETKYRDLFEFANDAIYIIKPDGQTIVEANEEACQQTGYSREELCGAPLKMIKPLGREQEVDLKIDEILRDGSGLFEHAHRRKDGTEFPVEISARVIDYDNHVAIQAFARDISARKEAEKESAKLLQAIEFSGEAIIITDRHAVIEYVNPAFTRITGYSAEEAIGNTPALLKSGEQGADFYRGLWKTIQHGDIWKGSLIDRRKDGKFYPGMLTIAPIKDADGNITHFVGSQQDISEYLDLEERFNQAQKMEALGTLVGGVAHDFNNILAAIMGNTYLAKRKSAAIPDLGRNLEQIETSSNRAADMVSKLLTFARKERTSIKPLPLVSFFKEVVKLSKMTTPENIVISSAFPAGDITILGDPTQLQQVLMNLIINASHAVEAVKKPRINITLEQLETDAAFTAKHPEFHARQIAHIAVRDNGIGIPKENLERIFEPFFTTKGIGKGTGLGLSMVYGAMQNHGGIMDVESAVGEGTTFHICLPVVAESMAATPEAEGEILRGNTQGILVVDDEELLCGAMAEVLQELGYRVFVATGGAQAQKLYNEHAAEIDLALLDVVMPGMSGIELALWLRQQNEALPVIFATGYDKQHHMLQPDKAVDGSIVLAKPVAIPTLSQALQAALQQAVKLKRKGP